jgi:hypothetical protein
MERLYSGENDSKGRWDKRCSRLVGGRF